MILKILSSSSLSILGLFALGCFHLCYFSDNIIVVSAQNNDVTTDAAGNAVIGEMDDDGCVANYDSENDVDYFPMKYRKPTIASYGDVDVFGNQFEPHDTTDFLDIEYHNTYKIVTNSHQQPPQRYLLYQCGTDVPQDVIDNGDFDLVTSVPLKGGLALSETPQIPYVEMLGLREEIIAYIGDPQYVTSPCMSYMLGDDRIKVVHDYNSTIMDELLDDFRKENPDAIIVSGPTNNVVGDQVVVSSATQERTNVATFDWIAFYAAFYNLEGESNRIATEMQDSYDCTNDVANTVVATEQQRDLDGEDEEYHTPTIFWASYVSWGDLGWSVAECPTWDNTYYCEYAAHCDAIVLSRPDGVGSSETYGGSPTVYWYLNDTEAFEMGKDADVFIYSGSDWDSLYESHGEMLDQFKSVQNKRVFDTLGQGPGAWFEQRYAEYDTVGLDMCDVVGHTVPSSVDKPPYERRWFRNVYTDPIGSLPTCDVAGGEIGQPYVPPVVDCVRSPASESIATDQEDPEDDSNEQQQEEPDDSSSASVSLSGLFSNLLLVFFSVATTVSELYY